jgi:hypothetical protein
MANTSNIQILQDGPRNVVVKLIGIIDTSDVAAAGTIGASGFTTTLGSPNITFVAGALVPTVGQYLTFGDAAATFAANTYVVSITDATHIVVSSNALKTNAAAAVTITGVAGVAVLLDPTKLSGLGGNSGSTVNNLIVDYISYNVESPLAVNLYWEGTTNTLINTLVNSGDDMDYVSFGGLWNNAPGKTGEILYTTQGWSTGAILSYNITLECRKS